MCGRFTVTSPLDQILDLFALEDGPDLGPRYNVAPTQEALVVRTRAEAREREAVALRWGLVPRWADDPKIGNRLINARSETVHSKPSFRDAFAKRRCLVPADGFIEWKNEQGGKQPYHIVMEDRGPFAFAGIWESWKPEDGGELLETFTILTTTPNDTVEPLHDRMPVIVSEHDYDLWLADRAGKTDVAEILRPFEDKPMMAYPVSRKVNKPSNDSPDVLERVAEQGMLF
jgi:putative SOS response-associated peptidase YedK